MTAAELQALTDEELRLESHDDGKPARPHTNGYLQKLHGVQ